MNNSLVEEIRRIAKARGYWRQKRAVTKEHYSSIRERQRFSASGGKRRVRSYTHRMTDSQIRKVARECQRRLRAARKLAKAQAWSYEI